MSENTFATVRHAAFLASSDRFLSTPACTDLRAQVDPALSHSDWPKASCSKRLKLFYVIITCSLSKVGTSRIETLFHENANFSKNIRQESQSPQWVDCLDLLRELFRLQECEPGTPLQDLYYQRRTHGTN